MQQGLNLTNKVDFAVSRWCFHHLADPTGTFAQVFNLLRPGGYVAVDGFFFEIRKGREFADRHNSLMTQLFLDTKAPFLTLFHNKARSLNHFLLQRPNAIPCPLPMSYVDRSDLGASDADERHQIGAGTMAEFRRVPQESDKAEFHLVRKNPPALYGDKRMYEWLKKSDLLVESHFVWKALQAER